jgi:squalene synthase HpnC
MGAARVLGNAVDDAFAYCEHVARSHYENFPVASVFIPASKRKYVWNVYAFARAADDFADEGNFSVEERLAKLDTWSEQLEACYAGRANHAVFIALAETVERTGIPRQLLADLLTAFRMDVTTKRYNTFEDLLGYCRCSANPVGRLVLWIFGDVTERKLALSDSICTALQLTNFWQDIAEDWAKDRIYMPLEDMARFGYTESDLANGVVDSRFRELVKFQVDRTYGLFRQGAPLIQEATRQLRFELALTVHGGQRILRRIEGASYDVLRSRPTLSGIDKVTILFASLLRRIV